MALIIDRRLTGSDNNKVNRQKFFNRAKTLLKESVKHFIKKDKIKDISLSKKTVKVKTNALDDYVYSSNPSDFIVLPKNTVYKVGDKIKLPPSGGVGKSKSGKGPDGESQDEITFELTREEFLDLAFDGYELPNWDNTKKSEEVTEVLKFGGFTSNGLPSNIDLLKSFENAIGRQISNKLMLKKQLDAISALTEPNEEIANKKRAELVKKIKNVPFLDDIDLKYRYKVKEEIRTSQAVIFFIMDVSASMGEQQKQLFKYFCFLFYLFVEKNYTKVLVHFVVHTTEAKFTDEQNFFNCSLNGGTYVSSALLKVLNYINTHYNSSRYNVYTIYGGDFDSISDETREMQRLLLRLAELCQAVICLYLPPKIQMFFQVSDTTIDAVRALVPRQNKKFFMFELKEEEQTVAILADILRRNDGKN